MHFSFFFYFLFEVWNIIDFQVTRFEAKCMCVTCALVFMAANHHFHITNLPLALVDELIDR